MQTRLRPGLGAVYVMGQETPPADPRGWTPRRPACGDFRYLADGTPEQYGSFGRLGCRVPLSGSPWIPVTGSPPGLRRWVDGIEQQYGERVLAGLATRGAGWQMTPAGKAEYDRRVKAMVDSGGVIYAALPPGVTQETPVSLDTGPIGSGATGDPVLQRYVMAWTAASQRPHADAYTYVDPETGTGSNVLPDGYLDPDNGGEFEFLTGQRLDDVQRKYGVAGYHWYWIEYTHPASREKKIFLVQFIKHPSSLTDKLKQLAPTIVSVVGGVLAPFTFGISAAVSAVLVAGYQIREKRIAAERAKRQGDKAATAMSAAVAAQNADLARQVDDVYRQYPDMFVAAGYTPDRWAGMTLDEKLDVMQRASDGTLVPVATTAQVAQSVQQDVNQAVQNVSHQIDDQTTAGAYEVYVEGVKVGTGGTLDAASAVLSGSAKLGDRIEVSLNGKSLGLKLLTSGGVIAVPPDQEAAIRAMSRGELDALLARASSSAGSGGGGVLLALAAAGIIAAKVRG